MARRNEESRVKLRILYRGHVSGRWVPAWALEANTGPILYATRDPELAGRENRRVERIEIDHIHSRVLREGTKPFARFARLSRARPPRQRTERIVELADREGYDVVWFRDGTVAIANPAMVVDVGTMTLRR